MSYRSNATAILSLSFPFILSALAVAAPNPALVPPEDDPKLARVLIIGDSISMGYTVPSRELLADKANVHHPAENCGPSTRTLDHIEQYLGDKPWDVITFNNGIHDLTHRDSKGKFLAAEKGGKIAVPLEQYKDNVEKIVERLKKTNATLIWCSTTPVGDNVPHRNPADVVRYNEAAKEIMERNGIRIVDLYALASKNMSKMRKDGVHFSEAGSKMLAEEVSHAVDQALTERANAKPKTESQPVTP